MVAARREPATAIIAAAQMHADDHARWFPARGRRDGVDIDVNQAIGIFAEAPDLVIDARVFHHRQRNLVELDERAPARMQFGKLLAINRREVGKVLGDVGIGTLIDPLAAAEEIHVGRGRHRYLDGTIGQLPDELEFVGCDALAALKLAGGVGTIRRTLSPSSFEK